MSYVQLVHFMHILAACICCVLAAPAFSGAAISDNPNRLEQHTAEGRVLSVKETLLIAKKLVEQKKLGTAEQIYLSLSFYSNVDISIEAKFQLAQLRLNQGKFRQAISLFNEILSLRPSMVRVRLELARAYFLDGNYEDSTFQFELAKGGNLPPEVLANIDFFLNAIRRKKSWTIDFSISPVSDSNINQASGGREECINTIYGTLCRPLEDKTNDIGLKTSATVDYFWRFHQDWGLRSTVGFYGTTNENKDYNDHIINLAIGPRYIWDNGEVSVQSTFRKRWVGNKGYSEEYGLRLDARQFYGRLLLSTGASISSAAYDDDYVDSLLKGATWSVYLQPRYILTDQTFIQAGLNFTREETKVLSYANENQRYSIGLYHNFPYGISIFAEGSLTLTKYQAPQWYVTKDNRIDETVREDKTWQLFSSLASTALEKYDLTPMLQYTYTKRDSNLWTREYDRHQINLLLNYKL